MGETMDFPKTPQEFIEQYKIKDSKEVYTNGSDLVPVFRVKQMIEHYFSADVAPVVQEHRISKDVAAYQDKFVRRYCPKYKDATFVCRESECKYLKCEICAKAWASEMASKMPDCFKNVQVADRCVCCGDVIPEGRQVCPACEGGNNGTN